MKRTILIFCAVIFLGSAAYSQSRQDVVDDGFTWFEAFSTTALTGNNVPTATGWTLKYWVRVIGEYPDGSGLNFVVAKAGRPVFSTRCGAYVYRRAGGALDESFLRTAECWQSSAATKETGEFDVQVYVVDGRTKQEKLVRTYRIDVRTVGRVPPGQGAGTEPPRYFINRHAEAAAAFIFVRPAGYIPYFDVAERPERLSENNVELHFSLSPPPNSGPIPYAALTCTVNGRPFALPGPLPYATQAVSTTPRFYREIHQDRLAPAFRAGMPYEEEIRFQMVRTTLPLSWGRARGNRAGLDDQRGNWECTLGQGGVVWRTFRWTIGADGMPVAHPEQQRGNVSLGFNTYLVEMDIPAGGSLLDGRLNGASESFFYGRPWTTAEGRAMAARVPRKGRPFPVPSNATNR